VLCPVPAAGDGARVTLTPSLRVEHHWTVETWRSGSPSLSGTQGDVVSLDGGESWGWSTMREVLDAAHAGHAAHPHGGWSSPSMAALALVSHAGVRDVAVVVIMGVVSVVRGW
jgi:hypothetical protein